MGARSAVAALTETRGDTVSAGHRLYVGVDVGRREHIVAAISEEQMLRGSWERAPVHRVPTNGHGFRELTEWLRASGYALDEIEVGCEPTGGWYAQTVAAWLERHGYVVSWLQNAALHERRQLLIGKQTKTDALDARLIARLLFERACFGQRAGFLHRPPRGTDALRMLVRNRHKLVEERIRYRQQLTAVEDVLFPELKDFFRHSITGRAARHFLEAYPTPDAVFNAAPAEVYRVVVVEARGGTLASRLADLQLAAYDSAGLVDGIEPILHAQRWLLEQLHRVDDQVERTEAAITGALEVWPASERAVLASLPGMSPMRQAVLLSAIGDLATFSSDRQLRKFLGWYPELRESGSSVAKHHLGLSGRRLARREIWLWSLALCSPRHPATPFRAYYQRLRERGVTGHVALGHLAGKLISVLFYCVQRNESYDADRHFRDLGLSDACPVHEP
ncbi:MAG TPA: IS110 family transposase [Solirubrobacteraceae bacterium]|nr:IS110 family transposase [Solirubrobacteraceae bacterium]